jgi:tetratricopeptide (TPR) repeat protein
MRIAGLALVAAVALSMADPAPAHARDAVTEGRTHLRKANGLAGNDRCEAAIKEYSLAYEKLHDPVVLFNRAECYRRIGEDASAAADYRAFLDAVPGAPNRAEIEAKIANLDLSRPPAVAPAAARAAPAGASRSAPAAISGAPSLAAPAPSAAAPAAPLVAPSAPTEAMVASSSTAEPSGPEHHGALWMWAALGIAVAGGAVGAYFVLRTPGATPPSTELGNYRF